MKYWAILDKENRVVGEWNGNTHWVSLYEQKSEAKNQAIALNIPNFQIVDAAKAMQCKPSELSK